MYIITTSFTQEITSRNKCQMRFLDTLLLKQDVDKKSVIIMITCSMLEYPSTSDDDEMNNGISKSTILEHAIKH